MIKSIVLKKCTPFHQAELSECKIINFVFGANGSGKSTISSLLAGDEDSRFKECSIEWNGVVHEPIYVYNREFRKRNFQQTIPGVFTIGSATIDDINALEQMKIDLAQKREKLEDIHRSLIKQSEDTLPNRENIFKDDAWNQILKRNEKDFKQAFEGFRNNKGNFITELKRRISGIPGHEGRVCDRQELLDRAAVLYASKPERCDCFPIEIKEWTDKIEAIREDPIWKTVIAGNKDVDIAALIEVMGNSSWVEQGRKYIKTDSKTCPFCQQDTITEEFKIKLETFFDTTYKQQIERVSFLKHDYESAADSISIAFESVVHNENAVIVGKLDTEKLLAKNELLKGMFSKHEMLMDEKISEPGIRIEISSVLASIQEIKEIIEEANARIDEHNKLVNQRETEEEKLRDDIWATAIHDADSLIKAYYRDIRGIKQGIANIEGRYRELKGEVDQLEQEIVEKGKNITSVQPTIDEINRSLKAYGFDNFSIQPAKGQDNSYCIEREDGTPATGTLSEGEETFLTFLYFMQWTKGSIDPEHVSDKKIIVLDDPISSLDSTILYIVSAMVKDLSKEIRERNGDVVQLFVLTHNVFFHKEASYIDGRNKQLKDVNYWIVRKNDNVSSIDSYDEINPISTSYELLWRELRENSDASLLTVQNTMRRIIENYFNIIGNYKRNDYLVEQFETAEEKMIARSLLYWINDGSHSIPDDLYIDHYSDAIPKYKTVFRELFNKSGHSAHYNMMMQIDDDI